MSADLQVNKPELVTVKKKIFQYTRSSDAKQTIKLLEKGQPVLIALFYSNGLTLLKEIHLHLAKTLPNKTFKEQREYRKAYHELSNLLIIEVKDHVLAVKKAPFIGWLKKLYPENNHFHLTFPQVQGLNSAWQWFDKGIVVPVMRNKLHPYYGVYFPTRFDHLILFDNWLKRYSGEKKSAIDIGIGSGVLTFQMIKHGFQTVFGTDVNPNAIVGLAETLGDTKLSRKIHLDLGALFGKYEKPSELIVFNPPWLPESRDLNKIDEAIYYNENLFPDFFTEAKTRLLPDGKLVVLFSNLAQITNATKAYPIEKELLENNRFKLEACLKRKVKLSSDKTKREQSWRSEEEVELWILTHK